MSDIFSKEKRYQIMSSIRGVETKPEILVRKFLFANKFRYRKNDKRYPGKPDILLPKYKTAVFVNGCYWHGHSCPAGKLPKTNRIFWFEKIESNKKRDKKNILKLRKLNWNVIVVWQCSIKNLEKREKTLNRLIYKIVNNTNH